MLLKVIAVFFNLLCILFGFGTLQLTNDYGGWVFVAAGVLGMCAVGLYRSLALLVLEILITAPICCIYVYHLLNALQQSELIPIPITARVWLIAIPALAILTTQWSAFVSRSRHAHDRGSGRNDTETTKTSALPVSLQ